MLCDAAKKKKKKTGAVSTFPSLHTPAGPPSRSALDSAPQGTAMLMAATISSSLTLWFLRPSWLPICSGLALSV